MWRHVHFQSRRNEPLAWFNKVLPKGPHLVSCFLALLAPWSVLVY